MRCLSSSRPGSDARYGIVTAFCALTQSATLLLSIASSQRYGSLTLVPAYVSTWSTVRVVGYWTRAGGVCAAAGASGSAAIREQATRTWARYMKVSECERRGRRANRRIDATVPDAVGQSSRG